ncbi:GIY-YIG nuclease family protein [Neisseria sp. CCUG12390]|uniref:GIY-YIG nuclease family protein n=1 Tax=Neisseria sp. CCUG12390 TaxID=3392035 RepID=UPI003A1019BD
MTAENWCVYLILCTNESLYCGITNRPNERFQAHLTGKGARYTRIHKPIAMRVLSDGLSKSEALKQEIATKKLSAKQKNVLWKQMDDTVEIKAV